MRPATGGCRPRIILDGAHNDHSLRTVLSEVTQHLKTPAVLFACAKDKNSAAMLQALAEARREDVVFTHSGSPRGRDPGELAQLWLGLTGSQRAGLPVVCGGPRGRAAPCRRGGTVLVRGRCIWWAR